MTYSFIASATSSPRRIDSSSFSRWISSCTVGATAMSATANTAMIAITAIMVMPASPRGSPAVCVLIATVLFGVGIFRIALRPRRPIGAGRDVPGDVRRDAGNIAHVNVLLRHILLKSGRASAGRPRGSRCGTCHGSGRRPVKFELVTESQIGVFENGLGGRNADQSKAPAHHVIEPGGKLGRFALFAEDRRIVVGVLTSDHSNILELRRGRRLNVHHHLVRIE